MQAVQIQQIVPQIQTQAPSTAHAEEAPASSFMDELKARLAETEEKNETTAVARTQERQEARADGDASEPGADGDDERLTKAQKRARDEDRAGGAVVRGEAASASGAEGGTVVVPTISEVETVSLVRADGAAEADAEDAGAAVRSMQRAAADSGAETSADGAEALLAQADALVPASGIGRRKPLQAEEHAKDETRAGPALAERADDAATAAKSAAVRFASDDAATALAAAQPQAPAAKAGSESASPAPTAKKSPFRFEIHDLRSEDAPAAESVQNAADAYVQRLADKKEFNAAYTAQQQEQNQLTMELTASAATSAEQNITSSNAQAAGAASSTFQSMLASAVQENAPDFVRAGSIVLRDNNQGSINLILHPESLGNVKIQLSLSDKVISGQITVHSTEAYQAFKDGIDSIKQAFAQSGFDTGSFDLNFSGSNNFAQGGDGSQNEQAAAFRAKATYGDSSRMRGAACIPSI